MSDKEKIDKYYSAEDDIDAFVRIVGKVQKEEAERKFFDFFGKKTKIYEKSVRDNTKSIPTSKAEKLSYDRRKISFIRIKTLVAGILIGTVLGTSAFALWGVPKIEYFNNVNRGKEILTEAVIDKMVSLGLGGIDENGNLALFNNECSAYKELGVDSPLELYLVYDVIEDATTSTKEDKTYEKRKFMESVKDAEGKYTYSNLGDYLKYQGYFAENLDGTTNTNRGSVSVFENYMEAEINDLYTNGNIGIYCQQELLGGTLNNYEEGLSNQGGIKK